MNEPPRRHPEPEIIPPDRSHDGKERPDSHWQAQRGPEGDPRVWVWRSQRGRTRLYGGRPGPLGLFLVFAAIAALGVVGFFVFLGVLAISLPLIGAVVLAAIIAGLLRRL